jgi:GTP 3',8-cyclase
VLEGIETASAWAIGPIKINAVAVKDLVEPDIVPLARFGRERGIEIRYIEFMPLDAQNLWDRAKVLLADDILAMLEAEFGPLDPVPDPTRARRRSNTAIATASERWGSSPRSAGRSA